MPISSVPFPTRTAALTMIDAFEQHGYKSKSKKQDLNKYFFELYDGQPTEGHTYDADEHSCLKCNLGLRPRLPSICVRRGKRDVEVGGVEEEREGYFFIR
jgi:hypothetical protein